MIGHWKRIRYNLLIDNLRLWVAYWRYLLWFNGWYVGPQSCQQFFFLVCLATKKRVSFELLIDDLERNISINIHWDFSYLCKIFLIYFFWFIDNNIHFVNPVTGIYAILQLEAEPKDWNSLLQAIRSCIFF